MRRLFSTFAPGAPGVGLLLMRAAAGMSLIAYAWHAFAGVNTVGFLIALGGEAVIGVLVLLGLWTPVASLLTAFAAAWIVYAESGDPALWTFVGVVGIALALLGPGMWSIDARLFGWKRLEPRNGNGGASRPD